MSKNVKFLITAVTILALGVFAAPGPAGQDNNAIDQYFNLQGLKKKPFSRADDLTFVRRLYLDLTGLLPSPDTVDAFLEDRSPDKRQVLIENVMNSEAHINRWTHFFDDLLMNQRVQPTAYYRNGQHEALRNMVAANMPWDQMAKTILTNNGVGWREGGSFFQFWAREAIGNQYRLDYLDDQVGLITETMLGISTDCISCHDGAHHLESINKDLANRKREEFWGMAAFLSKTYVHTRMPLANYPINSETYYKDLDISDIDHPDFNHNYGGFINPETRFKPAGEYMAQSDAGDGMRQPRSGGQIMPRYLFTGEEPQPGELRREALARILVADRQFARNMVNRVWAHFMGTGFVEPLGNWDLARLSPQKAAEADAEVQPREHLLMESLTTYFIESEFNFQSLFRVILNSRIYQADYASRASGSEDSGLAYWSTDRRVRRLEAESIIDTMYQILETPRKYTISGEYNSQVATTWELPGPSEPSNFFNDPDFDPLALGYASYEEFFLNQTETLRLLTIFGRSDRSVVSSRKNDTTAQTVLTMMNDPSLHHSLMSGGSSPYILRLVESAASGQSSPEDIVDNLYFRILFRAPTPLERGGALAYFKDKEVDLAIRDLAWTLFNHPNFTHK